MALTPRTIRTDKARMSKMPKPLSLIHIQFSGSFSNGSNRMMPSSGTANRNE